MAKSPVALYFDQTPPMAKAAKMNMASAMATSLIHVPKANSILNGVLGDVHLLNALSADAKVGRRRGLPRLGWGCAF